MAIARNGDWLVTTGVDGTARVWEAASGAPHILTGHTGAGCPRWRSPQTIAGWSLPASMGRRGSGRPPAGHCVTISTGHTDEANAVAIAEDGSWLVTIGNDGIARVWDPGTGALRHTLTDHIGPVYAVAIATDSSWLVTGGNDGTPRTGIPRTGALRQTLSDSAEPVYAVTIATEGGWLVTTGYDGPVRAWDPNTGTLLHRLTGHAGWVGASGDRPSDTGWPPPATTEQREYGKRTLRRHLRH